LLYVSLGALKELNKIDAVEKQKSSNTDFCVVSLGGNQNGVQLALGQVGLCLRRIEQLSYGQTKAPVLGGRKALAPALRHSDLPIV